MKDLIAVTELPKLPARKAESHKGDYGKICIAGGCIGFSGAPAIAGRAAFRAGAGLVRIAAAESVIPIVASLEPCYTMVPLAEEAGGMMSGQAVGQMAQIVEQNDAVAFGPGAGVGCGVKSCLQELLHVDDLKLVIDADGLNNLAKLGRWQVSCRANLILTPHPGEMQRIWEGVIRDKMPAERLALAAEFAQHTESVVVLKGHKTVVTDGARYYINQTGNPGMAAAGAGDVLTGVITALCGQGMDNFDAAVLGVYVHGLAGDIAAESMGQVSVMATDIIDCLPSAFMKNQQG